DRGPALQRRALRAAEGRVSGGGGALGCGSGLSRELLKAFARSKGKSPIPPFPKGAKARAFPDSRFPIPDSRFRVCASTASRYSSAGGRLQNSRGMDDLTVGTRG